MGPITSQAWTEYSKLGWLAKSSASAEMRKYTKTWNLACAVWTTVQLKPDHGFILISKRAIKTGG